MVEGSINLHPTPKEQTENKSTNNKKNYMKMKIYLNLALELTIKCVHL